MNTILCVDGCIFVLYWLYVANTSHDEFEFLGRMCHGLINMIAVMALQGLLWAIFAR